LGSAAIAITISHPFDVLKTRQQLLIGYENFMEINLQAITQMLKREGYQAIFTGLIPRIIHKELQLLIISLWYFALTVSRDDSNSSLVFNIQQKSEIPITQIMLQPY